MGKYQEECDYQKALMDSNALIDSLRAQLAEVKNAAPMVDSMEVAVPLERQVSPLPCPFCGSTDVIHTKKPREFVMCDECGGMADSIDTLPERTAIEVWNMRANV